MNKTIEEIYLDYINFLNLKNKITTVLEVKRKFNNYILPYFGKFKLFELDESKYIDFQLKIRELNYSESFDKNIYTIMKCFFTYLELNYGIKNIPAKVGLITNKNKTSEPKEIWTKHEFNKFIKKVDNPIYHALFNLLFYAGLRKGEALALKISDFDNNTISITKTLTKEHFNGKRILLTPKSKKSNRKIPLDLFMSLELKKLLKYYSKNYDNYNSDLYLFGGPEPIATTTLDRKKNYYCDLAKVKRIRIHDFRHSHATMLYQHKVKIKLIQERLGHADISTTLNIYVHSNDSEQKRLIKKINLLRL